MLNKIFVLLILIDYLNGMTGIQKLMRLKPRHDKIADFCIQNRHRSDVDPTSLSVHLSLAL